MISMTRTLLALLVLSLAPTLAQAEPTDVPPPRFPLKLAAPDKATWTITPRTREQGGNANEAKDTAVLRQLTVRKAGKIYHEAAVVDGGPGWEHWFVRDAFAGKAYEAFQYAGEKEWKRHRRGAGGGDGSDFSDSDFEDLQWVGERTYKGVVPLEDGRMAYLFEITTDLPLTKKEGLTFDIGAYVGEQNQGARRTLRTWIDPKTLLPLILERDGTLHVYAFDSASDRLSPPSAVVDDLRKWLEEIKLRSK